MDAPATLRTEQQRPALTKGLYLHAIMHFISEDLERLIVDDIRILVEAGGSARILASAPVRGNDGRE